MKRPTFIKPHAFINDWPAFYVHWDGMSFQPFRFSALGEYAAWLLFAVLALGAPIVFFFYLLDAIGLIHIVG